ncbi:2-succinyl-6-hydroxy-2,4-cyclohexadiene-1-carboxylate synthase [Chamaesiphon minutus]|uniref:2-succinyl-6-hydroxy-2,4-cyclohexadiene-1-carboxylate synthase n=1 Tax=Chamaesiphon minutus (strain ATCC 27169 / PCC 6605) TaxID=1173020 RepID=K9UHE1_CHAP6|nr:2-succinyl-6-hydroxy-2,4-cyclohexadiene-1-carboxylate synthase [Chamaesiphon minutus]AFY94527.1 2-succinyl-6-hydroxy-2,4-cyclohexadiene-1-carboxylate synthase [Chamaesiphon minutus PCC 6605]
MYRWHFISTDNRTLPPLLLLHGWMGSSQDYVELIDRLKSQFYCIAIDLPGHGKTEVIDEDRGYDFVNTASGIIELLDSLNIDRTSISGYSFGGRLALYLVLEFPDRFVGVASGNENRIILESTSPGLATALERQVRIDRDRQIIDRLATTSFDNFVRDWYRQPIFIGIDSRPNFPTLIRRRIATNRPIDLAKSLQYAGLGMQPYLGDRLKLSTRSISLIVGALDEKFVDLSRELDRMCPSITLNIIPNCSHNIHFEQPALWLEQIKSQSLGTTTVD